MSKGQEKRFRGIEMNSRKIKLFTTTAIATILLATCSANSTSNSTASSANTDSTVLRIADQGFFSAGGTVTTSEGTFDLANQWEETGTNQISHVDHANVLYQVPKDETEAPMIFLNGFGHCEIISLHTLFHFSG